MKYSLEWDLMQLDNFFNMRSETHTGFVDKLTYDIGSNSYVRILKEAIDKTTFTGYNIYTDIDMVVDSEDQKIKYELNVAFDKL